MLSIIYAIIAVQLLHMMKMPTRCCSMTGKEVREPPIITNTTESMLTVD